LGFHLDFRASVLKIINRGRPTMAKKFFRKYLPHPDTVKRYRALSVFGRTLHAPNLWHLNRHSVARACAVGAFWAVIPIPLQLVPAALFALMCRANVALTVFLVCLTNPLTIAPVYYGTYRLGRVLLGIAPSEVPLTLTMSSIGEHLTNIWQPLYAGSVVTGLLLSGTSYLAVCSMWRWNVGRRWRGRRARLPAVATM
jgi:uncharacterized protein (DUF2062 family)